MSTASTAHERMRTRPPHPPEHISLALKLWFCAVLVLKVLLCFFMGHFDIYRFLVFLQHAIAFPQADPWTYRDLNVNSDFPYPPALFYLLKGLVSLGTINPIAPHEPPAGPLYALIKAPIFVADLLLAYVITQRTSFRWMVATYWTSSIIVFHQYYSGQFDILVAAPFVLGLWRSESYARQASQLVFFAGVAASAILKPFALIFMPATALLERHSRKRLVIALLLSAATFLAFKASELPYSGSAHYREQMGAGAASLLVDVTEHKRMLFPIAFVACIALIFFGKLRGQWLSYTALILCMGAFAYHSAGWMTWAAVMLPVVMYDLGCARRHTVWFIAWNVLFVLRWAYCPTSPLLDSASVFTDQFLGLSWHLPMGYLYSHHSKLFGYDIFKFFGVLFAISSLALLISLVRSSQQRPVHPDL